MKFNQLVSFRRQFIKNNNTKDHVIINGDKKVLISAPHGVSQVRLGKLKTAEPGALATALWLRQDNNCYLIAKTKNNNDDVNFDEKSSYKRSIEKLIKEEGIKYIIDFHGLDPKRDCDVNLGIHLGKNIKTNEKLFNDLYDALLSNNFVTKIDAPFMAGCRTISWSMADKFPHVWTLQIEINCGITNRIENFDKYKKLLNILSAWIKTI